MNKISSRDIRMFVAGALAIAGFRALISIPHLFTISPDAFHAARAAMAYLLSGLALPIGIGIFLGRWSALLLAQIYLWLRFISNCAAIPLLWYFRHEEIKPLALILAPDILVASVLLGLIFWTTSERFRYEPDV